MFYTIIKGVHLTDLLTECKTQENAYFTYIILQVNYQFMANSKWNRWKCTIK